MKEILELVNSDNKEMSAVAIMLVDLEKDFTSGSVSKDEYIEILKDLENTHSVKQGGASIELKGTLLKGISALLKLA
jgi:hypothetical protein